MKSMHARNALGSSAKPLKAQVNSPIALIVFGVGFLLAIPAFFVGPIVFLLVFALTLSGIGVGLIVDQIRFGRWASRTEGVVIDLVLRNGGRGGRTYHPVVQFVPVEAVPEEKVVFESPSGSRPAAHRVGDRVPLLYDPTNPLNARINSWVERWLLPSIPIAIGCMIIIGIEIVLFSKVFLLHL